MMEREEVLELLRDCMSINVSTSINYECRGQYLNTRVSISLDGEEIVSDDASTFIED